MKEGAATTREAEEGAAATTAPSAELERRQPNAVQPRRRPRDRGPTLLDARAQPRACRSGTSREMHREVKSSIGVLALTDGTGANRSTR